MLKQVLTVLAITIIEVIAVVKLHGESGEIQQIFTS